MRTQPLLVSAASCPRGPLAQFTVDATLMYPLHVDARPDIHVGTAKLVRHVDAINSHLAGSQTV